MLLWIKGELKKYSLSVYTYMQEFFDPTPKSEWKLKDMHYNAFHQALRRIAIKQFI